jgi:hypothetical protein
MFLTKKNKVLLSYACPPVPPIMMQDRLTIARLSHVGNLYCCYYLPPNNFPITGTLASGFAEVLFPVWLPLPPPPDDDDGDAAVWLVAEGVVCGCFAAVVALVVVTLNGVLVWLIIAVVAFPVGVTVALLLTAGNFAWLPGGDSFVWLPEIGTFPTGSVFSWMVVVVWLAGNLVWLIIFVACFPAGVTFVVFDFFVQILQRKLQKQWMPA